MRPIETEIAQQLSDDEVDRDLAALVAAAASAPRRGGKSLVQRVVSYVQIFRAERDAAEARAVRAEAQRDEAKRETQHEVRLRLKLLQEVWRDVYDSADVPDGWLISESELLCAIQDMHRPDAQCQRAEAQVAAVRDEAKRLAESDQIEYESRAADDPEYDYWDGRAGGSRDVAEAVAAALAGVDPQPQPQDDSCPAHVDVDLIRDDQEGPIPHAFPCNERGPHQLHSATVMWQDGEE